MVRAQFKHIPRINFVDTVIQGVEAVDAKTGANWKSGFTLNPNTLEKVRSCFLSHTDASTSPEGN